MHKQRGLASQFMRLLTAAGLGCTLLFLVLQFVLRTALMHYADHTDFVLRETRRLIGEFQSYVTEQQLASNDVDEITQWVQNHNFTLLELYRDHVLVYSSFAPRREMQENQDQRAPFYDWQPHAEILFSDGTLEALLYCNSMHAYEQFGTGLLLVLCIALFLGIFLAGCRRIVRYLCLLSNEIQAMEAGDLNHPITIQGSDELTTLARCLDSMRLTLCRQQDQEAEAAARVKSLITQMSHDLRTPLTTLLLYTEILSGRKYTSETQLQDYLNKIDAKARQIKYLSDNLFEYALVTRDTAVTLDPPARLSQIFEGPLAELMDQLGRRGFACGMEPGSEDLPLQVYAPYIRRILDNITSNILKYADPEQPVSVRFLREEGRAGLAFCNAVSPDAGAVQSTKVGLLSIQTMMEKMQGETRIESGDGRFCIALLFPVCE